MSWTLEQAEAHLLSLELFGMKFGLERMRRAAHRARQPAAGVPLDPRGRHQRQELDGPDGGSDPRGPRHPYRCVSVAAPLHASPSASGSATPTSTPTPSAPRSSARRGGGQGRPHAVGRRARDPVRAAHRRGVLRARRARRGGGGGRGRPRRPPRRHQRARRAGRGAHQRRPRAHPLARPDDHRHRAREARGRGARLHARRRRARPRGRGGGGEGRRARGARGRRATEHPSPASSATISRWRRWPPKNSWRRPKTVRLGPPRSTRPQSSAPRPLSPSPAASRSSPTRR